MVGMLQANACTHTRALPAKTHPNQLHPTNHPPASRTGWCSRRAARWAAASDTTSTPSWPSSWPPRLAWTCSQVSFWCRWVGGCRCLYAFLACVLATQAGPLQPGELVGWCVAAVRVNGGLGQASDRPQQARVPSARLLLTACPKLRPLPLPTHLILCRCPLSGAGCHLHAAGGASGGDRIQRAEDAAVRSRK